MIAVYKELRLAMAIKTLNLEFKSTASYLLWFDTLLVYVYRTAKSKSSSLVNMYRLVHHLEPRKKRLLVAMTLYKL